MEYLKVGPSYTLQLYAGGGRANELFGTARMKSNWVISDGILEGLDGYPRSLESGGDAQATSQFVRRGKSYGGNLTSWTI
jgi:hypothetical protein